MNCHATDTFKFKVNNNCENSENIICLKGILLLYLLILNKNPHFEEQHSLYVLCSNFYLLWLSFKPINSFHKQLFNPMYYYSQLFNILNIFYQYIHAQHTKLRSKTQDLIYQSFFDILRVSFYIVYIILFV